MEAAAFQLNVKKQPGGEVLVVVVVFPPCQACRLPVQMCQSGSN